SPAATPTDTLSLHDALPICYPRGRRGEVSEGGVPVAKASQRSRKRSQPHAGKKRAGGGGGYRAVEQQMFFPRLRRQAKWMFILLDRKSTRLNSSHQIISYAV